MTTYRLNTVAIVGVGLLGGSIGLALRSRGLAEKVVGIGRSAERLEEARKRAIIDEATTSLAEGVSEAELIVVCTPVESIVGFAESAADHAPTEAVITDVGSTKHQLVDELDKRINARPLPGPRFVGSHPLAGSERAGAAHARPDLLEGKVVVVTPTAAITTESIETIRAFWEALGARIVTCSPQAHDEAVAAISHLPHLVAAALAGATAEEHLPFAAAGWRDTTRIAAGEVELWRQILLGNRDNVLKSLDNFEALLAGFRQALKQDDSPDLTKLLEIGKKHRDAVGN